MTLAIDAPEVDVADDLSQKAFFDTYVAQHRPVVLRGVARNWPAFDTWSNDVLIDRVGGARKVRISTAKKGYFHLDPVRRGAPTKREMRFDEYVATLSDPDPTVVHYLQQLEVKDLPGLRPDFSAPKCLGEKKPSPITFWFGPGGTTTPLHYDLAQSILCMIRGKKEFVLFPPSDLAYLYPYPLISKYPHFSRIDLDTPDLARFTRLKSAHPVRCRLEAGDGLFVPSCWWHQVVTTETSVALGFCWYAALKRWAGMHSLRRIFLVPVLRGVGGKLYDRWFERVDG